jgi:hypothetical protein
MDKLLLEGTMNLPSVDFDAEQGLLKITGRSIPEHPVKFYQPLETWILTYIETQPKEFTLFIHLDYLNTHSTECVLMIMKRIQGYYQTTNNNIQIVWGFDEDDEDMESLGEDLSSMIDVPFKIKELK